VCLQETKLEVVSPSDAYFIGGQRLRSFAQRLAIGTQGGILLLWDASVVNIDQVEISEFCLSAMVYDMAVEEEFKITTVYGPSTVNRKDDFFNDLKSQKPQGDIGWIALGILIKFIMLVIKTIET
jgi:hypothetical protein